VLRSTRRSERSTLRNLVEFLPAWLLLRSLGLLPRKQAIQVGKAIGRGIYYFHRRLRRVARLNLKMAMPELGADQQGKIINGVFDNLGRLLGEFSQFPKLNSDNVGKIVEYAGFENYRRAAERGSGVLMLTGHFGAWELCSFAHGAFGHPLSFLVRPLDNPLLDSMIDRYRGLSGNVTIDKNKSVRRVLEVLKSGGEVGFLIDVNTVLDQGVFCDFFGIPACSTTGLAVFALRSEAPVVPGFLIWDEASGKHRLHFEPEIPLIRTGDFRQEVVLNTEVFNKVIEDYVRRYPDQWLWVHKRWQTRPPGEPDLYKRDATPDGNPSALNPSVQS